MSSPYRDAPPSDPSEPLPDFGNIREPRWYDAVILTVLSAAPVLIQLHDRGAEAALLTVELVVPALVVSLAALFLERRVRAWFARRDARAVAEGIIELEAKAEQL